MVAAVVMAVLALPAAAAAQNTLQNDPSTDQYGAPIPEAEEGTGGESASGLEANIGFLPFTGMDLLVVAGIALVLTGTGFALQRLASPRPPIG